MEDKKFRETQLKAYQLLVDELKNVNKELSSIKDAIRDLVNKDVPPQQQKRYFN